MELEEAERELMALYEPRGARTVEDAERMARADMVQLEQELLDIDTTELLCAAFGKYGQAGDTWGDSMLAFQEAHGEAALLELLHAIDRELVERIRRRAARD